MDKITRSLNEEVSSLVNKYISGIKSLHQKMIGKWRGYEVTNVYFHNFQS